MHRLIMITDQSSVEKLNDLLGHEEWWVTQTSASANGTWLVTITDTDPELLDSDDEFSLEDADEEEF